MKKLIIMSATEPQEADLPKSLLKRLIVAKLQDADKAKGGDGTRSYQVNKDALLAFGEAAKLFIHYLTAAANDNCKDAKRQTISAEDVMIALTDLEFGELVEPLKASLEAFKLETREKNKKKAEMSGKKRKAGDRTAAAAEEAEEEVVVSPTDMTLPPGAGEDGEEEEPAAVAAAAVVEEEQEEEEMEVEEAVAASE